MALLLLLGGINAGAAAAELKEDGYRAANFVVW